MNFCKAIYIDNDGIEKDTRVGINRQWFIIQFVGHNDGVFIQLSEEIILNIAYLNIKYKEGDRAILVVDNSGKKYTFNYSTDLVRFLCEEVR